MLHEEKNEFDTYRRISELCYGDNEKQLVENKRMLQEEFLPEEITSFLEGTCTYFINLITSEGAIGESCYKLASLGDEISILVYWFADIKSPQLALVKDAILSLKSNKKKKGEVKDAFFSRPKEAWKYDWFVYKLLKEL